MNEYRPAPMDSFEEFDKMVESCYVDQSNIVKIIPSTLEGCVVRVSDIIAYLGKDRLDAMKTKLSYVDPALDEEDDKFRTFNAKIINNLEVNIIEHSYGKPYIKLDEEHYSLMRMAKRDNYARIYNTENVSKVLDERVRPLMQRMYKKLLSDLKAGNKSSPIFKHHIDFINNNHYSPRLPYLETEPNQIVIDYMASMTDDYCTELYGYMFPDKPIDFHYHGYFEDLAN